MLKYFSEIERLKRKARRAYYAVERIGDEYDSGHALTMVISPRYAHAYKTYEACKARLREIDPTYPKDTKEREDDGGQI